MIGPFASLIRTIHAQHYNITLPTHTQHALCIKYPATVRFWCSVWEFLYCGMVEVNAAPARDARTPVLETRGGWGAFDATGAAASYVGCQHAMRARNKHA